MQGLTLPKANCPIHYRSAIFSITRLGRSKPSKSSDVSSTRNPSLFAHSVDVLRRNPKGQSGLPLERAISTEEEQTIVGNG